MPGAPLDRKVCLLIHDSGRLRPYIGEYFDGGWICRMPLRSEKIMAVPHRFCLIPTVPFGY